MPRILVSYRRADSAAYAGRLADRLKNHFGRDNVFVDIDTIRPGEDFAEAIDRSLSSCTVLVALIGSRWLDAEDAAGLRRLDGSGDFVRREIATALERYVRVIPTLVGHAVMPEAKDLPPDLQALTRRQAIEISDTRFHQDVDRLIEALSDTASDHTNQLTSNGVSTDKVTGKSTPLRLWILGTIVVMLVAIAGYWRLTTGATPNSDMPTSRKTSDPKVGTSPGSASAQPANPVSNAILNGNSGEPAKEIEPNDDILHSNVLALGTTVRAEIRPVTDKDFFRIHTPPGDRSEVRVVLSNRSKLMPEVEIWDSKFNSVTSKYNVYGDVYLNFDAEPSADYFVECRFIAVNRGFADSQDSGAYELTVLSNAK